MLVPVFDEVGRNASTIPREIWRVWLRRNLMSTNTFPKEVSPVRYPSSIDDVTQAVLKEVSHFRDSNRGDPALQLEAIAGHQCTPPCPAFDRLQACRHRDVRGVAF